MGGEGDQQARVEDGSGLRKEIRESKAGEEIVALSLSSGPVRAGKIRAV